MSDNTELCLCVLPCSFPYITCELATVDVSDALGKVRARGLTAAHKEPESVQGMRKHQQNFDIAGGWSATETVEAAASHGLAGSWACQPVTKTELPT
jgi:hypothetical protein